MKNKSGRFWIYFFNLDSSSNMNILKYSDLGRILSKILATSFQHMTILKGTMSITDFKLWPKLYHIVSHAHLPENHEILTFPPAQSILARWPKCYKLRFWVYRAWQFKWNILAPSHPTKNLKIYWDLQKVTSFLGATGWAPHVILKGKCGWKYYISRFLSHQRCFLCSYFPNNLHDLIINFDQFSICHYHMIHC